VLVVLVVDLSSLWWRAGAHPGGAHEAAGNEAGVVDLTEDQSHQLRHEFLHPALFVLVLTSSSFLLCALVKL
jgi:hypothetical protein